MIGSGLEGADLQSRVESWTGGTQPELETVVRSQQVTAR